MEESTKQIAEGFSCKYTVFKKGTDPDLVEKAYFSALQEGRAAGFYPAVVCLDGCAVDWLKEVVPEEYSCDKIIAGCRDNGCDILKERYEEYMEDYSSEEQVEFIGEETQGEVLQHFCGYISFVDGMLDEDTLLLELPVKHPWEIIGYLPMGGWNECPDADDMIAVCKYWYKKYHAVPAVFTHDVMEFYAPEGLNGVDSLEAAKEHFAFCPDRVQQGTQTYKLSELAAGLEGSKVWYFWWD